MATRKLLYSIALAGLAAQLSWLAPSPAQAEKPRHVLIIGVDGAMPDAVKAAKAPNLKALADAGTVTWDGFAGGVLGTPSRQNTASLASWHSILTGVWANKHKAARMFKGAPVPADHKRYPALFQRVKEAQPKAYCASIVNWPIINQVMVPGADFKARGENDAKVVEAAAKELAEKDPTVLFIQFDEVDHAGHGHGYSPTGPKYLAAIEEADRHVGQLLAAVKARKNYANEEWLVIAVSDHGGSGTTHGGDTPEERKVFLIVSGPGAKKAVVSPGPGIVAVTPTALEFLGVKVKPEWNLDAKAFGLGE